MLNQVIDDFLYGGYFSLPSGQTGFLFCHSILSEVPVDNIAPSADESKKTDLIFTSSTNRVMPVVVFKRPFFSSYTTSLWIRFLRFSLSSHKKLEDDIEKLGLTPPQFYVLATIGYAGGLPFGEIGAKMMVTVSNLTGIVDRLEEKKLVSRKRDENDRRVVHVVLTERGVKLYKNAIPLFEKSIAQIFSSLDKPAQKELSALLRKLSGVSASK